MELVRVVPYHFHHGRDVCRTSLDGLAIFLAKLGRSRYLYRTIANVDVDAGDFKLGLHFPVFVELARSRTYARPVSAAVSFIFFFY